MFESRNQKSSRARRTAAGANRSGAEKSAGVSSSQAEMRETIRAGRYCYRAYGLAIRSDIALPELEPDDADAADLNIRLRPINRSIPEGAPGPLFEFAPGLQFLAWPNLIKFLIRGVGEIDVDPAPGVDHRLIRLPLLGAVMALLLHLRGMLVLHASAVAITDRGAIFLGDKEAGKSTTAAALVAAGHRLLADDVVAIDFPAPGEPRIRPGFPQLKLNPDAAHSVIGDAAMALPIALRGFQKRQHRLLGAFSHALVPPTRIYVLGKAAAPALTPVAAGDGLTALIRFSYVSRFGPKALGAGAPTHLRQCAAVANVASVFRLDLPSALDRLAETVRLVESDLMADGRN